MYWINIEKIGYISKISDIFDIFDFFEKIMIFSIPADRHAHADDVRTKRGPLTTAVRGCSRNNTPLIRVCSAY